MLTMFFTSPNRPGPMLPTTNMTATTISRPIHYYTTDSLHFNELKDPLYGEINSKESLTSYEDELSEIHTAHQSQFTITTILSYVCISIISITSLALYAAIVPMWERNFAHTRSPAKGDWTDGLMILPLSMSLVSSTLMIISAIRKRHKLRSLDVERDPESRTSGDGGRRHRHRGTQATPTRAFYTILLSSTIALLLGPLLVLASTNSLARAFRPAESGQQTCNKSNILTKPCMPILYRIGELQIGAAALAGIVCSMWIGILVLSVRTYCKIKAEEERLRQERRKRRHARRKARKEARHHRPTPAESRNNITTSTTVHGHFDRGHQPLRQPLPTKFPCRTQREPHRNLHSDRRNVYSFRPLAPSYRSSEQIIGLPGPTLPFKPRESMQSWLNRR